VNVNTKQPLNRKPVAKATGFLFLGKLFFPLRKLNKAERAMSLHEFTDAFGLADCPEFQRAEKPDPQKDKRPVWNYTDFYETAKAAGVYEYELFLIGNQQVIPCQNYLAMLNPYCYGKGSDYCRKPSETETPFAVERPKNPFFGPYLYSAEEKLSGSVGSTGTAAGDGMSQNKSFIQGYACCLAALIRSEGGVTTTARELFGAGIQSVEQAEKAGVDESDLETFRLHQKTLEQQALHFEQKNGQTA